MQVFRLFLCLMVILGGFYPLVITAIAQLLFPYQANGSFIELEGKKVGSELIAQSFKNPQYFWPRPSAIDYNALQSGGSNLGPTSSALKKKVEERRALFTTSGKSNAISSELLFASGSGLDPHISPSAAFFQIDQIIEARGLDPTTVKPLLKQMIKEKNEGKRFYIFGVPVVNVLKLNIALDELTRRK